MDEELLNQKATKTSGSLHFKKASNTAAMVGLLYSWAYCFCSARVQEGLGPLRVFELAHILDGLNYPANLMVGIGRIGDEDLA
jgi:hypothetical protein